MSVAVVGDSYVRRLGEYLDRQGIHNLRLPAQCSASRFYGLGGAKLFTANRDKCVLSLLDSALDNQDLRVLFLHVGSNDLSSPSADPIRIASGIISLAQYAMHANEHLRVVVSQLFARCPNAVDGGFADRKAAVHTELIRRVREINSRRLSFAPLRGLCRMAPEDFHRDGVHLSTVENRKFYRGVRGAIIRAHRRATEPNFPDWMPLELSLRVPWGRSLPSGVGGLLGATAWQCSFAWGFSWAPLPCFCK
jgi:hypothetical protein